MNNKTEILLDIIDGLSVGELSNLKTALSERFNVPFSTIEPAMIPKAIIQEETPSYSVSLEDCGPNKMSVLKLVREVLGLGLKESKDFVDSVPKTIKDEVEKSEAESIQKKFVDIGAVIKLSVV